MLRLRWVDELSLLRVAFAAVLYGGHVAVGHAISVEAETRCSSVTNGCVLLYAFFFFFFFDVVYGFAFLLTFVPMSIVLLTYGAKLF